MTNRKTTRRALVLSLLSLLLCCSMLVGTTFAWFTDSVTSGNNKIVAGNLDIELYWSTDCAAWTKVDKDTNIFDTGYWEPGHTEVVYLKAANEGTLALKYQLGVNVASETGSTSVLGNEFKLSQYIEYGIVETDTKIGDRKTAVAAVTNATKLATPYSSDVITLAPKGQTGDSETVALVVYMPETVGNEANHRGATPTILLGLNVQATQVEAESDSFGNNYDSGAAYADVVATTAAELEAAIAAGNKLIGIRGGINLTKSLGATGVTFVAVSDDAAIDFGTYGISGTGNTFKNLSLDNDRDGWYKGMQYSDGEDTTYENCVIVNGVTTYGNSTFKGCTFNELPAGNYALFIYDGVEIVVEDCVFNYGNRAIKIYNEGGSPNISVSVSDTAFKASATSVANKAMIEIDDSLMQSVKVTVSDITIDSAIAAQGVYRINDGALNTSTAKSVVSVDGAVTSAKVASQTDLDAALASEGEVAVELAAGSYKMPSVNTSNELTIVGTKDTIIDNTLGAYMESSKVSFEGVTIKGSTGYANGNGSDYAALYTPNVTYTNCTFDGPFRIGRDGATFIGCTFTNLGNDYVWTYGNDCTFENCIFESEGKALLIYSDGGSEVSKVTVKGCTFNATQGRTAWAIANQNCAAIEIQNYGNGVDLTLSGNTVNSISSDLFSGLWRIKAYHATQPAVIINGTTYTSVALDGKLMTVDADRNATFQ